MTPRLVTIPFSHYCEKARWSLERCGVPFVEDPHMPLLHWLPALRAGGGRTVPILVADDARVIADSTDIAAWADARSGGALRRGPAALALEDDFDRQLGPATRRWGYQQLLPRADILELMRGSVPGWELAVFRMTRPVATGLLRRGLRVTPAGVARSLAKIDAVFARVGALLADGRRFLTGPELSIADVTFAALASPALRPAEVPFGMPADLVLSPAATAQVAAWRATPAGRFALALYAHQRARSA